jgi:hypothetical protein
MAIGTTIDGLNTVTSLTEQDKVPVWDAEASNEPTKKITAQNMANSVKSLASLPNTTEMNAAIAQSTADMGNSLKTNSMNAKFYNNADLPSTITANQILNLPIGIYQNRGSAISAIPSQYGELIVFKHAYYTGLMYFAAGGTSVKQLYYAIEANTATAINWVQVAKA